MNEDEIETARRECGRRDGLLLCPEGAATLAAQKKAIAEGRIDADASAVLFNCGSGLKYEMPDQSGSLDKDAPIDYAALAEELERA